MANNAKRDTKKRARRDMCRRRKGREELRLLVERGRRRRRRRGRWRKRKRTFLGAIYTCNEYVCNPSEVRLSCGWRQRRGLKNRGLMNVVFQGSFGAWRPITVFDGERSEGSRVAPEQRAAKKRKEIRIAWE
jgi:hypothetical protein